MRSPSQILRYRSGHQLRLGASTTNSLHSSRTSCYPLGFGGRGLHMNLMKSRGRGRALEQVMIDSCCGQFQRGACASSDCVTYDTSAAYAHLVKYFVRLMLSIDFKTNTISTYRVPRSVECTEKISLQEEYKNWNKTTILCIPLLDFFTFTSRTGSMCNEGIASDTLCTLSEDDFRNRYGIDMSVLKQIKLTCWVRGQTSNKYKRVGKVQSGRGIIKQEQTMGQSGGSLEISMKYLPLRVVSIYVRRLTQRDKSWWGEETIQTSYTTITHNQVEVLHKQQAMVWGWQYLVMYKIQYSYKNNDTKLSINHTYLFSKYD